MIPAILDDRQMELWRAERKQVQHLLELLAGWDADPTNLPRLRDAAAGPGLLLKSLVGRGTAHATGLLTARGGPPTGDHVPYSQFVHSKHQHLQEIHATLDESLEQLFASQMRIKAGG